ncbi:MAG: hypothetical protein K0U36_03940 [Alphaproteobacteria bacterium]|nr:hypothetical protein [Alphaproteobacteria bacterium]
MSAWYYQQITAMVAITAAPVSAAAEQCPSNPAPSQDTGDRIGATT